MVDMLKCPEQTKGWVSSTRHDLEIFTTPVGLEYTRCSPSETADIVVEFTKIAGLEPVSLKLIAGSKLVKRAVKKQRKLDKQLRQREGL